jgi:hypothetical protein
VAFAEGIHGPHQGTFHHHGGHGSEAAGPVARRIIEAAFGLEPPPPAVAVSTRPALPVGLLKGAGLPVPARP